MNEIQPEIDTTTSNISSVFSSELIDKSISCLSLENGDDVTSVDPYTTALSAYALVLANRTDDARKKIDWLMNHAQRNNSLLWWHKIGSSFSNFFPVEKLIKLNSLIRREWTCSECGDDVVRPFEFGEIGQQRGNGWSSFHRPLAFEATKQRRRFHLDPRHSRRSSGFNLKFNSKSNQKFQFNFHCQITTDFRRLRRTRNQLELRKLTWKFWSEPTTMKNLSK